MGHQKTLILFFLLAFTTLASLAEEVVPSSVVFPKVENIVKNHPGDYIEHSVKRMGNKKINLEAFFAAEADWAQAKKTAEQVEGYPKWVLPRLNERGGGEKFFIQFATIVPDTKNKNTLEIGLYLDLPALKIPITRLFKFEPINNSDKNVFTIKISAIATEDSPVKDLNGYAHVFRNQKNPNQVWGYLDVTVVLTHWLVYESLPERLLNREVGDRLRILMENYQNFENTKLLSNGIETPQK